MESTNSPKLLVNGKAYDFSKAKVAVPITVRNMDRCCYETGTLYLVPRNKWVRVMKTAGDRYIVGVDEEDARKLLTSAGRLDLVRKYFDKPPKEQEA